MATILTCKVAGYFSNWYKMWLHISTSIQPFSSQPDDLYLKHKHIESNVQKNWRSSRSLLL